MEYCDVHALIFTLYSTVSSRLLKLEIWDSSVSLIRCHGEWYFLMVQEFQYRVVPQHFIETEETMEQLAYTKSTVMS